MNKKTIITCGGGVFLLFSTLLLASAIALTVDEIAEELMCTCGCGKLVVNCDCDLAQQITSEIQAKIQTGESRMQILNSFYEKYGDAIRATPAKSGLELLAWTIPVGVAIVGTVVIFELARRKEPYTARIGAPIAEGPDEGYDVTDEEDRYDKLFKKEFEKFKRRQTQHPQRNKRTEV